MLKNALKTIVVALSLLGFYGLLTGCNRAKSEPGVGQVDTSKQLDSEESRIALAAQEDAYYHGAGRADRPVQVRAEGVEHRNLNFVTSMDEDASDNEVNILKQIRDQLRQRLPAEANALTDNGFERVSLIIASTDGKQLTGGGIAFIFRVTPKGLVEITNAYLEQHGTPTDAIIALMKGESKSSQ